MKKVFAVAGAAIIAMSLVPGVASAGKGKGKKQEVEGSVAFPAPYTDDSGCYAGLHRRASIMTMGTANGIIGYEFDIDPATWNKNFVLEATGGQGHIDLDIYFYAEFGTPEDVAGDPLNAGSPYTIKYNTREAGGEAAKVPPDMTKVIVCLYGGQGGQGGGATFTYTAGKGVKIPK
ncbi:MAG: hypothetical protein ACRDLB_07930 [Actinomycetota bacterium]